MSGQRSDWRERLHANASQMEQELAIKLQDNGISYLTQVDIPVTTIYFSSPLEPRPLLVCVDGRVHLGKSQAVKDEELRTLLRKREYRVLELYYNCSHKQRDRLFEEIFRGLRSCNRY